jgi:hypothetical protein
MTDLALRPSEHRTLIDQMNAAVATLDRMMGEEVSAARMNAAAIEAAAHQTKAAEVEQAAARLRLFAERRIGELRLGYDFTETGYSQNQLRSFLRLARIPRSWHDKEASKYAGQKITVDLFLDAVEYSLKDRSKTAYAVYVVSLRLSANRHPKYAWLRTSWDGIWLFDYFDPKSHRTRRASCDGTLEQALEMRAELSGKVAAPWKPVRANSPQLLPINGKTNHLGPMLDAVRRARSTIGDAWAELTPAQRAELDGVHGKLDDLAAAIVRAVNL